MERVRLRHHQAEELIAQAKQEATLRQAQIQKLQSIGRIIPCEASLLGCWQVIERTLLYNVDPSRYAEIKLGEDLIYFRILGPDKSVYGESISCNETAHIDSFFLGKFNLKQDTTTFDLTGKVISDGLIRYRKLPNLNRVQTKVNYMGQPWLRIWMLAALVEARWHDWTMEGKGYHDAGETSFKAVFLGNNGSI